MRGWYQLIATVQAAFTSVESFTVQAVQPRTSSFRPSIRRGCRGSVQHGSVLCVGSSDHNNVDAAATFVLEPYLTCERTLELFAWVSCSIQGGVDERYDDSGLALKAIFGRYNNAQEDSNSAAIQEHAMLVMLKERALNWISQHGTDVNISQQQRELNSLGPLGAGQWSGQYNEKYPHSILTIDLPDNNTSSDNTTVVSSVDDWIQSLPRTCRQTIRKARSTLHDHNLTIATKDITSASPHSTLDHFRCVLEHEIRIATSQLVKQSEVQGDDGGVITASYGYFEVFFNAVLEAVERYAITIQGCGTILEYRHHEEVVAFCHIVGKGTTLRGQWFYASNFSTKYLLWFHSIWYMVNYVFGKNQQEHIYPGNNGIVISAIDLGPNGSDGQMDEHAVLKSKYGFLLYEDWPEVAAYQGPFFNIGE